MQSDLLADGIVVIHLAFMLFVLLALVLVLVGIPLRWQWTRNLWFRLAHLISIGVVAAQAVVGVTCPLTTWEENLRGDDWYNLERATVVGKAAHDTLFYRAPPAVFMWAYIGFGVLVLAAFVLAPPRLRRRAASTRELPEDPLELPLASDEGSHQGGVEVAGRAVQQDP